MSVSLPDLIRAIRGMIPTEKCNLLEELVQKLQRREVRLNRQEFLHKVRDIAGDDAPALRQALKHLALERRGTDGGSGGGGLTLGGLDDGPSLGLGDGGAPTSSLAAGAAAAAAASLSNGDLSLGASCDGLVKSEGDASCGGGSSSDAMDLTGMVGASGADVTASGAVGAAETPNGAFGGGAGVVKSDGAGGGAPAEGAGGVKEEGAGRPGGAAGGSGGSAMGGNVPVPSDASGGAPAPAAAQQQQRLEVAAAAVLVHAAGCKNPACTVPHCNKMKKIHTHFLECSLQGACTRAPLAPRTTCDCGVPAEPPSPTDAPVSSAVLVHPPTTDCAICKKLKPLTFIHAKHCVAAPGESCVIPYCARAKRELQLLVHRRGGQPGSTGGAGAGGAPNGLAPSHPSAAGLLQAGALLPSLGGGGMGPMGAAMGMNSASLAPQGPSMENMGTQAQAHYLLVLAHVMKCPSAHCTVPECAPTKALVTNHTRSCRAGDACTYPRCALSKRLMRHHRECPDQQCQICLPLRRRLAAAKVNVAASSAPSQGPGGAGNAARRKSSSKRKKDDEEDGADPKRKRKDGAPMGAADPRGGGGGSKKARGGGSHAAQPTALEVQDAQMAAEQDVLESGFCVSVHFGHGKRQSQMIDDGRGEWRSGIVMRTYISIAQGHETVYDIMMSDGREEKGVAHSRCRMVCNVCLSDKRAFRPPPMFCEKCFTAIHQRWSYWEEGGDEGGLKLCKRCFSDIKASANPNRMLCDLAHRPNLDINALVEKKEKDRPEYVDNWVQCDECHSWMHWTCGLYKGEDTPDDCLFFCDNCRLTRGKVQPADLEVPPSSELAMDPLSTRLQDALRAELKERGVTCAPVTVRVVSNVETVTKFDQQPGLGGGLKKEGGGLGGILKELPYRSKCILAFQHIDGHEVCFFAMYVQEYGSDCPEPNTNRVYISYLDSVRYFVSSPEGQRTTVYHSMLINYIAYARELGFTHAHIWVSPPKQGDDYIFYAHPEAMVSKRMGLLKLKEWYEKMLETAKKRGIVHDFQDMQEEYKDIESIDDIPMFSGDHWAASIVKKIADNQKAKEEGIPIAGPSKTDASSGGGQKKKKSGGGSHAAGASSAAAAAMEAVGGDAGAAGAADGMSTDDKKLADETMDGQLLNQITEEMRSMRNHFVVVTLIDLKKSGEKRATIVDPVPLISNEFVDTRSAFLEKCQMYHWQFDELRNAQHSTLMLLYYLHGKHKPAKAKMALQLKEQGAAPPPERTAPAPDPRSRSSKIETAMHDWSTLLAHANSAAQTQTWDLPPDELFQRILAQVRPLQPPHPHPASPTRPRPGLTRPCPAPRNSQINRSKRDILQEKYNACLDPNCSAQTRSVFIRVLKRIAESFMTCLLQMQSGQNGFATTATSQPTPGAS